MFSLDAAVRCMKNLIGNASCWICDKLEGDRVRYACGHVTCAKCVNGGCALCLSQSDTSYLVDPVATQQAKRALELLNSFQEAYKIDVNQYLRRSEQLKIEKEIFKDCIIAPATYTNKRKSAEFSSKKKRNKKDKENKSYSMPGENMSAMEPKMSESSKHVKEWLNKNENIHKRIPFQELEVNTSFLGTRPTNFSLNKTNGKRSHLKAFPSQNDTIKSAKKKQRLEGFLNKYADESGIVIDEDDNDAITIHDTQSEIMDKDKLAWLAVLDAYDQEKQNFKDRTETKRITEENSIQLKEEVKSFHAKQETKPMHARVPYYKMGPLYETCKDCKNLNVTKTDLEDVCITIQNSSHIIKLTVSNVPSDLQKGKKDSSVQTDTKITHEKTGISNGKVIELVENDVDMHAVEVEKNTRKQLIIEESDSEEDSSKNVPGILTELDPGDLQNRTLRGAPNISPTSTNSSEKENYNPNKKKFRSGKVTKKKKLNF